MKEVKNFVVLGAGAMGAQIGALAAESGFYVTIRDIEDKFIERGKQIINANFDKRISRGRFTEEGKKEVMSRVRFVTDLKEAVQDADYIIEAVAEYKMDSLQLKIYPNPAMDKLHIDFMTGAVVDFKLSVIDNQGAVVYDQTLNNLQNEIPFSQYAAGTYFLKIYKQGVETETYKIIKLK